MNSLLQPHDLGTILSVWAHPDDETYLAAGVMAAAADSGQPVVCVSATAGEHGTSDPHSWPPLRLGRRRSWEAAAAMAVLGVTDHRILGYPDGALADHDDKGRAVIAQLLDDIQPGTILTFGPDGITFHPDHIAVSRWVTAAWEQRGRPCRLLYATSTPEHLARFGPTYEQHGVYMTDERPTGVPTDQLAVHLHLDGWKLDRKLTALAAMTSQTSEAMAAVDTATFTASIAEEAFIDATAAVTSTPTATQGTRRAEPDSEPVPSPVVIRPMPPTATRSSRSATPATPSSAGRIARTPRQEACRDSRRRSCSPPPLTVPPPA